MTGKRRRYWADLQATLALDAFRGELTAAQLATKYGLHQTRISGWERQAVADLTSVFSGRTEAREGIREGEVEKSHAKIGQTVVEWNFR